MWKVEDGGRTTLADENGMESHGGHGDVKIEKSKTENFKILQYSIPKSKLLTLKKCHRSQMQLVLGYN